ncbi:MAG: Penicillin-binding protein, partial [Tardiphaga sp.]|nr:Penicillin-binding protein [Tardiphaga sp.]
AGPGDSGRTILEAFKPGTAPPDNYSVIGVADAEGRSLTVSPDADRMIMRSGTGGLY